MRRGHSAKTGRIWKYAVREPRGFGLILLQACHPASEFATRWSLSTKTSTGLKYSDRSERHRFSMKLNEVFCVMIVDRFHDIATGIEPKYRVIDEYGAPKLRSWHSPYSSRISSRASAGSTTVSPEKPLPSPDGYVSTTRLFVQGLMKFCSSVCR